MKKPSHATVRVADSEWIRIQMGPWMRIRIQEGRNDSQKQKKVK
jgi:hypothetical protein